MKSKVIYVPIDSIEEPLYLLRPVDESDPEFIDLCASVKQDGIWDERPISVCPARDKGRFTRKDGGHRLEAARRAGLDKVPVVVGKPLSEAQILEHQIVANATVVRTKPASYARALAVLREEYPGDTFEMTAKRAKKPVEWVKKMLGLAPLEGKTADLVDAKKISIEAGLGLVRLQRAGKDLSEEILKRAQKEPAADFLADVELMVKGKKKPIGKLRPIGDFKEALTRARKSKDEVRVEVLLWALRLDPASVEESKTR